LDPYSTNKKSLPYPFMNRSRNRCEGCLLVLGEFFLECSYSKIPLIQLAWDWTDSGLLDVPNYEMVPILTYILTGNFLLLLLHLCSTPSRKVFHLDISFICWFTIITVHFSVF
jgi:hypothetical protein